MIVFDGSSASVSGMKLSSKIGRILEGVGGERNQPLSRGFAAAQKSAGDLEGVGGGEKSAARSMICRRFSLPPASSIDADADRAAAAIPIDGDAVVPTLISETSQRSTNRPLPPPLTLNLLAEILPTMRRPYRLDPTDLIERKKSSIVFKLNMFAPPSRNALMSSLKAPCPRMCLKPMSRWTARRCA